MSRATFPLLGAGVIAGAAGYIFVTRRNQHVEQGTADVPNWRHRANQIADLPWSRLHPALFLVNSQNLDRAIAFASAIRANQQTTTAEPTVKPAPTVKPEPTASTEPAPEPAPIPDTPTDPIQEDIITDPTSQRNPLADLLNRDLPAGLGNAGDILRTQFERYQTDEAYRAQVNDRLQRGKTAGIQYLQTLRQPKRDDQ